MFQFYCSYEEKFVVVVVVVVAEFHNDWVNEPLNIECKCTQLHPFVIYELIFIAGTDLDFIKCGCNSALIKSNDILAAELVFQAFVRKRFESGELLYSTKRQEKSLVIFVSLNEWCTQTVWFLKTLTSWKFSLGVL